MSEFLGVAHTSAGNNVVSLPTLGWAIRSRAEDIENVVFASGAALANLHLVLAQPEVPQSLLRDRFALRAAEAIRMAADLTRRTARLMAVAPKLRAKVVDGAVEMFLSQDAVAPSALPLPDGGARRLCDRLVDLGAVRQPDWARYF